MRGARRAPDRTADRGRGLDSARHRAGQRPLPDRLHGQQRARAGRAADPHVRHRLPLRRAGRRGGGPVLRAPARLAATCSTSIAEALPAGGLAARVRGGAHVACASIAGCASCCPSGSSWSAAGGLVERLRAVKEPEEIERIRAASVLADAAFERLIREGLVGRTEREVALALELDMRERGAERPSFETIVAAGPHGALPHAQPREVAISAGQLVVIDWGAELDGYCSDCTRTVATGDPGERGAGGLRARARGPARRRWRRSGPARAAARWTASPGR